MTLTSDPLNEAAGQEGGGLSAWGGREKTTNVHLTADVASCHSWSFLKGTWAKLQSGATDEQPGGSAFEPQWHLQYGQSAAQQAHQSKSALSSRCVWSQRSLTKPANGVSYWAFEKVSGEEKSQPLAVGTGGRWDLGKKEAAAFFSKAFDRTSLSFSLSPWFVPLNKLYLSFASFLRQNLSQDCL